MEELGNAASAAAELTAGLAPAEPQGYLLLH
jgi:hypothetical protein